MKLKLAFLQLLPSADIENNIEKGIKACREAREKGADIALFPEMWSSGYVFPHDEEWLKKKLSFPGQCICKEIFRAGPGTSNGNRDHTAGKA